MLIHDGATALSRTRTPEGFLRVKARIGRAGIHDYKAGEIGGPEGAPPDRKVRVYRPPEDVFDPRSLTSFAEKPVTLDHPPSMVDSANWKSFAVGHSGQTVTRDGDHVATELTITDAAAVARADAGAELSNGYWADFVFEPGVTPDGQPYDALQRNIRGNHIALVDAGRCGPTCRVDAATVDAAPTCGCATDDGATRTIAELRAALDVAEVRHRREVESKDGEIAALRAAVPDAATLDALASDRAKTLDAAQQWLGPGFDAQSHATAAIRRACVEKLLGPEKLRDRGEDYVTAAFDALIAARPPANPLAVQMAGGIAAGASTRETALAARNRYLTDAWKGDHLPGDL